MFESCKHQTLNLVNEIILSKLDFENNQNLISEDELVVILMLSKNNTNYIVSTH